MGSVTVAALRLLILTGQREREVTDAEWSEIDLDAALWRLPASRTKSGRAHLVHLAHYTFSTLDGFVRRRLRAVLRRRFIGRVRGTASAITTDGRMLTSDLGLFTMSEAHRSARQSRCGHN